MPNGVPVATVALNGAANAGLLAAQILSTANPIITANLEKYRETQKDKVMRAVEELRKGGLDED